MAHADTRRPFTRRGPPTEEEEREALRERRRATAAAAGLPPARSIPRTAFDPAQPTINPPGRDNGPRTQAELTAADEARKAAGGQPRARPEASQELQDLRRTRAEVSAFNRAEAKRKFDERRRALGLPPTAQERGEVIKTQAARHALLDGNTEGVPLLQGTLANATRRAQADPNIFPHNQIVRTTVRGRETFQRYNAIRGDFTPVTIDPLTGRIGIDTSDEAALSDAAVDDSFSTRIASLRSLEADPDIDPNSAKQLGFIASGLEAIQEATGVIGREEALKQANTLYGKAAAFIELEEEPIPAVLKGLNERVTPIEGFPGWFWTVDDKGNYKPVQAKVEETQTTPTTSQEFFSQGDSKEQFKRFTDVRKQAIDELEAEAQRELDKEKAEFDKKAGAAFNNKLAAASKKDKIAIKAAGPELFGGADKPEAPAPDAITTKMDEIVQRFLDARGPVETEESPSTAPTAASTPPVVGLKDKNIAEVAEELGLPVEEAKARLANRAQQ